jgi:diguanylate cyclase (GGDEF)-like protein
MYSLRKISQAQAEELIETVSDNIYNTMRSEIAETIHVSRAVANDRFLIELLENESSMDSDAVSEKLASYSAGLKDAFSYSWISITSDQSKAYYTHAGIYRILDSENNPDDKWYAEFVEQDKEYTVSISRDNDVPDAFMVFVDTRIEDDNGDLLGVCGIALEMRDFEALLQSYEDEYDISILFTDEDGVVQLDSGDEDKKIEKYPLPSEAYHNPENYSESIMVGKYNVIRYIDVLDWYMIILNLNPYHYSVNYLLIFFDIASLILFLVILSVGLFLIIKRDNRLFHSSYGDVMTGLYNRRAYHDHLDRLRDRTSLEDIVIIVFDVNGLKFVNDNLGHAAGDELINGAAETILNAFSEHGKCYRIGGDEFCAILDKPVENLKMIMRKFDYSVSSWEGELVKNLSISYGVVRAADYEDAAIDDLIYRADEKMYKKKKEYYVVGVKSEKMG